MKMKFYVTKNTPKKIDAALLPAVHLRVDNWDDFGTKCQFYMTFFAESQKLFDLGYVKILHAESGRTKLPEAFEELDEQYISLGQTLDFYLEMRVACGEKQSIEILNALRDISWQPPVAEPFEEKSSFRNSLLRESAAQKARRFGQAVISGNDISERYSFIYKNTISGAKEETECNFDLDAYDELPGRIVGIIGRNATGKTQYLSDLAKDLVHIKVRSEKSSKQRDEKFIPQRPLFNRLITVSYSAFDQFVRPKSKQVSYVYCGIRNEKGVLSKQHLTKVYSENLKRIRKLGREEDWLFFMREILGERSEDLVAHLKDEIFGSNIENESLSLLSSGQAILTNFITSLVAWLDRDSLVLFDEPETHLHPNAVASLFNVFNAMLGRYKSYAILATHSPLVIQELPRKRVIVFNREGFYTTANNIPIETFGENVAELSRHVFETNSVPSYYREVLTKLSKSNKFDDVMEMFDGKLSMNAQSFLMSQYMGGDDDPIK